MGTMVKLEEKEEEEEMKLHLDLIPTNMRSFYTFSCEINSPFFEDRFSQIPLNNCIVSIEN